jgi:hypothetical protein
MRILYKLFFLFLLIPALLSAQQNFPLNRQFALPLEKTQASTAKFEPTNYQAVDTNVVQYFPVAALEARYYPSCFKPYILSIPVYQHDKSRSLLYRKLKKESFLIINDSASKFYATIDPLMNFEFGKDQANTYSHSLSVNTRGIIVRGSIGSKFAFESSVYENQSFLPKYLDSFARASQVIPGQGRWKDFKNGGFDYAMSSGYVSYSPSKHFNIQAGTGKHFIGDGYRSLLLSDNAFNYPYIRVTTTFGIFQYTNLYASFMNLYYYPTHIPTGTEHLYQKKFANFQFLSINLHPRVQLGIFQALICQGADSTNRQHLDAYYYNPVIGISAAHYGFNDPNHILMGATVKIKVCSFFSLYGQYMIDDLGTDLNSTHNRQGFQAGAKLFDLFKIKNLHAQAEYNQVRPYAYSSANPLQNYSHYNQPLADPLGANFKETILILNYKLKGFFVELKLNYALIGADSSGQNFGHNVFASNLALYQNYQPDGIYMLQGLKSTLAIYDLKIGYLVNPAYNLNIVAGVMMRDYKNVATNDKTNYIYFGLRTSLSNNYTDF